MSFYSPISFLFLLGLVPIILMYLLKKQYEEIKISSTYLWSRALKDIEANTPWQRLRKNILLFLQLLIFTLIVFVLAQPYIMLDNVDSENLIIILDKSASMKSKDVEKSRFDFAKNEILNIINNLKPETYVTIVSMENVPKVEVSKTKNKAILKDKIRNIEAGNSNDNIDNTLSLINGIVKDMKSYKIIFYTDKGVEKQLNNMIVKNIIGDGINIGIENISHSVEQNKLVVLTTITNYSSNDYEGDVALYIDDSLYDVKEINIRANESQNLYWKEIPVNTNILRAELDIDDDFDLDNVRYHVINSNHMSKVLLVSKGNIFLEKSLTLNSSIELYKSNEALEEISGYELYIYDGIMPEKLPTDGNILVFNPPKENPLIDVQGISNSGAIKALDNQLINYVDLDFDINEVKLLKSPDWAVPVLLSNNIPVLINGEKENQKIIVVGFDLHNTDFPLKVGFPIFVQNILDYTLNLNRQEKVSVFAGEAISIDVMPKSTEAYIENPKGDRTKIGPPFPVFPYVDTQTTGVYITEQINNEESYKSYFVSNIDTFKESDIDFQYNYEENAIDNESNRVSTGTNIKNIFLWLTLILLAVEWVVYNRGY